jgi:deferrochelatase/peroxidase EfeB
MKYPACTDDSPDSSFLFYDRDQAATGCPAGSHVRRAFPRDALTPTPENPAKPASEESKLTLLQAANNHRILRRGRKFGTKIADPRVDDGANRGLLFMCLNTDIDRQFEFVQQTWLLNSSFATLFQEVDPRVGPAGAMTIRDAPLRRIAHVDTFVRMAGGDYFFLPSLPALRFLASL